MVLEFLALVHTLLGDGSVLVWLKNKLASSAMKKPFHASQWYLIMQMHSLGDYFTEEREPHQKGEVKEKVNSNWGISAEKLMQENGFKLPRPASWSQLKLPPSTITVLQNHNWNVQWNSLVLPIQASGRELFRISYWEMNANVPGCLDIDRCPGDRHLENATSEFTWQLLSSFLPHQLLWKKKPGFYLPVNKSS